MSFRNLIATGLLNALLWAGFSGKALGVSFTNGDLLTYSQAEWGDGVDTRTLRRVLLNANYTLFTLQRWASLRLASRDQAASR